MDFDGILLEFLEGAIHVLLYARGIYPSHLYEPRTLYGITVFQCRHPDVNAYIKKVLFHAKPLLSRRILQSVMFSVRDPSTSTASNIIDTVSLSCNIAADAKTAKFSAGNSSKAVNDDTVSIDSLNRLEEELRSAILKLSLLDSQLSRLDEKPGASSKSKDIQLSIFNIALV